jgi:uncharacterized GH25 family protein
MLGELSSFGRPSTPAIHLAAICALLSCFGAALSAGPARTFAGTPDSKLKAPAAPAKHQNLALTVMGPDGKVVPEITIEIRSEPSLKVGQILEGDLFRRMQYGISVRSTARGRVALDLPPNLRRLDFYIEAPGYAPYWAGWNFEATSETLPPALTAPLDAAWSAGGIVNDEQGRPIRGVKISPSIRFKNRPGDLRQVHIGRSVRTDSEGKWHFDSVPASLDDVRVEISHSDFMGEWRTLTRREFGIDRGRSPNASIVLKRGLSVSGRVTDENGKPLAGAIVRTRFANDLRKAVTGADGVYRLSGCRPEPSRLVVSAKGCAFDMKEVRVEPDMAPVNFQMQPGGRIRVRVVDQQGRGIARARIFFQWWRGHIEYFEFEDVNQYADKNGAWEWNEAPLDEFTADICPPDGMQLGQQSLVARKDEYVFRTSPALTVSGSVVDSETKRPIKSFRVVPGNRYDAPDPIWQRQSSMMGMDGHYQFQTRYDAPAYVFRVEADRYLPSESRNIKSNEGKVAVDFELTKGQDIDAVVLTPDGLPAAGAKVAMGVAGSQIIMINGNVDSHSTFAALKETDANGRFHFPPPGGGCYLVISHPSGYAQYQPAPRSNRRVIHLDPWTRVAGTFRVGGKPQANVELSISRGDTRVYGSDVAHIFTEDETTTGPDGRFVFERVMAGNGRIGRRIVMMVNTGSSEVTWSHMVPVKFPLGKTIEIDLGGKGRAVVGKLKAPVDARQDATWSFALIDVEPRGAQRRDREGRYVATVARGGTFRIDDLPPGEYTLSVRYDEHVGGSLRDFRFWVPSTASDPSLPPIDLGVLTLRGK